MLGKNKPTTLPPPTQDHILVEAVQDACIVLKTRDMAAVIEVEGIDITRLADDARVGLLAQFQSLLTSLRFHYQFIIARKMQRLEEYLDFVEGEAKTRRREGQRLYADHLLSFVEFIQEVVQRVNPQVPLYLLVLPYDPLTPEERVKNSGALQLDQYERGVQELQRRCELLVRGLTRLGLGARRLDNHDLVAILHRVYHPSIPDHLLPPAAQTRTFMLRSIPSTSAQQGSAPAGASEPTAHDKQ